MAETPSPEFLALQSALAGRYSLERELGRGGMGVVFLARDVALDRLVALKLLPPDMAARPDLRERFLREARTAAKLSHPNIVPIFAVEEVGEFVLFAMAYIEGESLGERVRRRGPLSPPAAARVLQEVAWALAYAHLRGVVHRDIKPDNILLEKDSGRALVTDFGIAHVQTAPGLTGVGEIVGTPQYMSPEQAMGDPLDGRSDLFSLGVVSFFALSGRLPFEAPSTTALIGKLVTEQAPPLASVSSGLPGRLAQAVDRCLRTSPDERFANAEEFAEAVAETTALAREVPTPLRVWMQRGEGARMAVNVWTGIGVLTVIGSFAGGHLPSLAQLAFMFGPAAGYWLYRMQYTQRVLAAGYTLEDIRLTLRDRAQQQREELAFESAAEPPLLAKLIRKVAIAAFGLAAGSGFLLAILPWDRSWEMFPSFFGWLWAVFGLSASGAIAGALLGRAVPGKRIPPPDPAKNWRMRLWNGRMGEWLTKLAGAGMSRKALPAAAAHRPTELAIGIAADQLFAELPKEARRELGDLPALLRRLEADAQALRARIAEIDALIAGLGQKAPGVASTSLRDAPAAVAVHASQQRLRDDLAAERERVGGRLATAVGALETIRLGLLRLKAGMGSVQEITGDLTAARQIAQEIDAAADGQEEVRRVLSEGA